MSWASTISRRSKLNVVFTILLIVVGSEVYMHIREGVIALTRQTYTLSGESSYHHASSGVHESNSSEGASVRKTIGHKLKDTKIILLWNTKYGARYAYSFRQAFKTACPDVPPCQATHNKGMVKKASAVVYFIWPLSRRRSDLLTTFPHWRSPNQSYVFYNIESPVRTDYHLERFHNFYNLTMTYRLDSDIPLLYGRVIQKTKIKNTKLLQKLNPMLGRDLRKKTKDVAWIVSHCKTNSNRGKYSQELRKYIGVDIYGKCGTKRCKKSRSFLDCHKRIAETYRFYLAFENSICTDYVTEKLLHIVSLNILPVVMNGANMSQFLPPKSYIDVKDFKSPKALADYLKYLSKNPNKYIEYFKWKSSYYILGHLGAQYTAFCSLCSKLHSSKEDHQKSYKTKDLSRIWGQQTCNLTYIDKLMPES